MNLILAYFTQELTREERRLIPPELLRNYQLQRIAMLVTAAVFLGSAIPVFTIYERFILWSLTFLTYLVRRVLKMSSTESR